MIKTILSNNKIIHIEYFSQKKDEEEVPDSDGNVDTCWRVNKVKVQFNPEYLCESHGEFTDNGNPTGWMYFNPGTIQLIQDEIKNIHDLPTFRSLDDFELPF